MFCGFEIVATSIFATLLLEGQGGHVLRVMVPKSHILHGKPTMPA
jgi:hypothetical protein